GRAPAQQHLPEPRALLQGLLEDLDGQAVVALARGQAGAQVGDIGLVPGIAGTFGREQIEGAGVVLLAVELHDAGIEELVAVVSLHVSANAAGSLGWSLRGPARGQSAPGWQTGCPVAAGGALPWPPGARRTSRGSPGAA